MNEWPPDLPEIVGVPKPRRRDVLRFVWWAQRGFLHGARQGSASSCTFAALLALLWWPSLPLLIPVQFALVSRHRARYYMTRERDAVLAAVATKQGWHIEDHASSKAGGQRGRPLRARVMSELIEAADTGGVAIYMTAAAARLAVAYCEELLGLVDVGRGRLRGRRLRREPRSSAGVTLR